MILVTVGSAPQDFSRLVKAMDDLAGVLDEEVVIQFGFTRYALQNARGFDFVPHEKMVQLFEKASMIVSHASAGPILYAEKFQKPLIIFPRSGEKGEHIDDHQSGFARAAEKDCPAIQVVFDVEGLAPAVIGLKKKRGASDAMRSSAHSRQRLIQFIKDSGSAEGIKKESGGGLGMRMKQLFYYLRIYRLLSGIWNRTFWMVRKGYRPKEFWNRWSARFVSDKSHSGLGPSHEWLRSKLEGLDAGRILEAGCGFGRSMNYLSQKLSGNYEFFGLDLSVKMLDHARTFLSGVLRARVICADISELPFPDEAFDSVYTRGTLMHCLDCRLDQALAELARVSKGPIFLVEEAFWRRSSAEGRSFEINPYTFIHDYPYRLAKLGWKILETSVVEEGMTVLMCLSVLKPAPKPQVSFGKSFS